MISTLPVSNHKEPREVAQRGADIPVCVPGSKRGADRNVCATLIACSHSVLLAMAMVLSSAAMALDVGVGTADITPDVKAFRVPMAGYGARLGRPATGVHDPLEAKVLFLREGAEVSVLVCCDLRSITPEFKQGVAERCADLKLDANHLFLAASHTHDGPSMYPEKFWQMQFGKYDPAIIGPMAAAVAGAIHDAAKNAAPAKLGFGEADATGFVHNRRWGYDNDARKAAGETPLTEPVVWMLRVDGMDGACRAVLVNFACHPTILDADNMLLSAEWPGVMRRELEKLMPGAKALFTNGGEGDQSPDGATGESAFMKMEDYGTRLARLIAEKAKTIQTKPGLSAHCTRALAELPPLSFPESAKGKIAKMAEAATAALPRKAEIQMLRIGPAALLGLPGEPILAVAQAVRQAVQAAGIERAVPVGLANDYIGYIVNEKEYAHGGYEVESRSYYGPRLGAFMTEQAGALAKTVK